MLERVRVRVRPDPKRLRVVRRTDLRHTVHADTPPHGHALRLRAQRAARLAFHSAFYHTHLPLNADERRAVAR